MLRSAQILGQHLLDHELIKTQFGESGMPDWEHNFIGTFLIQAHYMNERLTPQFIILETAVERPVDPPGAVCSLECRARRDELQRRHAPHGTHSQSRSALTHKVTLSGTIKLNRANPLLNSFSGQIRRLLASGKPLFA